MTRRGLHPSKTTDSPDPVLESSEVSSRGDSSPEPSDSAGSGDGAREGSMVVSGPIRPIVVHDPPLTEDDVEGYDDPIDLPDVPPEDWLTWETRYRETEDADEAIRYAVLAIGRFQKNAPAWAMEACVEYYERQVSAARSHWPAEDGERLDLAADLLAGGEVGSDRILAKGQGVNAAMRAVVAESRGADVKDVDHGDHEVRRLRKLWDKELEVSPLVDPDTGRRTHPRLERALVRLAMWNGSFQRF